MVGGGSSGCITAGRLVSEFGAKVLLLESGLPDSSPLFRMPAGFIKFLKGSKHLTFHETAPQQALNGRRPVLPTGRVLGGGSTVNAQVYIRGQVEDYDDWVNAADGDVSWSYSHLLPYFTAMEGNERLNSKFHGVDGPLKVSDHLHRTPLSNAFVAAAQGWGLNFTADFNAASQNGVGYIQLTTRRGRRCSAVDAYLRPVLSDEKLTLYTGATVQKILIENGKAVGVEYSVGGNKATAYADGEVVLCAGALATPQIMMLNGIGAAAELETHGIKAILDLPGVGKNLQDHHEVPVVASTHDRMGYFNEDKGLRMLVNGLQYLLFNSGPVTSNGVESCAFFDPDGRARPTIQMFCVPSIYLDSDVSDLNGTFGVTLNSCILRPRARGTVSLCSDRLSDLPIVDPRYLSDPEDMRLSIAGIRAAREILRQSPLKGLVEKELLPGSNVTGDSALAMHCKRTVKTDYHPAGTCKMGKDSDLGAVLDSELRVRGIEKLRVFDASMMPNLISGNCNATVMAVAYKATDMMMGRKPLAPVDLGINVRDTTVTESARAAM
ncbi:GMC family oxidoreductase [Burkholderia aenigmatica]|uniref:GMC family oxidoreductase n=1 Tax=Burkholderia aenigmatica TaxID=2015348 RepID=UPI001FD5581D|nr:GMC family oxidoreductase N-terminal domain-containing protein [Burkholderia aenigmatica]